MLLPGLSQEHAQGVRSIESFFAQLSEKTMLAEREIRVLLKAIAKAAKAAQLGDVGATTKAMNEANDALAVASAAVGALNVDPRLIEEAFKSDDYFREIVGLAVQQGLKGVRSTEGKLFSYPYVIEKKKSGVALSIGAKTTKQIRPSAVLATLTANRIKGSRFPHQALIDSVELIYEARVRGQSTDLVDIQDVYSLLTSLPGTDKDFPFLEFVAALDEIKRAGITSKNGKILDLPAPSTTGRSGQAIRVIREDGREQLYRMLRLVLRRTP